MLEWHLSRAAVVTLPPSLQTLTQGVDANSGKTTCSKESEKFKQSKQADVSHSATGNIIQLSTQRLTQLSIENCRTPVSHQPLGSPNRPY